TGTSSALVKVWTTIASGVVIRAPSPRCFRGGHGAWQTKCPHRQSRRNEIYPAYRTQRNHHLLLPPVAPHVHAPTPAPQGHAPVPPYLCDWFGIPSALLPGQRLPAGRTKSRNQVLARVIPPNHRRATTESKSTVGVRNELFPITNLDTYSHETPPRFTTSLPGDQPNGLCS